LFKIDGDLTEQHIIDFIAAHKVERTKFIKNDNYYLGKHEILSKKKDNPNVPNNKLVNNFARYIVDVNVGYLVGVPVSYSSQNPSLMDRIQVIFDTNNESEINFELAKMAAKNGVAYELMYQNEDGDTRFYPISPLELIEIYDYSIEPKLVAAIRYYSINEEIEVVEVYTTTHIRTYHFSKDKPVLLDEREHYFGDVPVVVYENNLERRSDFEDVITLIDAYNKAQSNTLDDMEQFTDSYLMLVNYDATSEDVAKLRESRVLALQQDGDAKWLEKSVNDSWIENYKTRLVEDIHKFSNTPDMGAEKFGTQISGVALKYRLLNLEQNRTNKERKFKKGLMRRLRLLANILNIKGQNVSYQDIVPQFTSNLPKNEAELAEMVGNLENMLSEQTLLGLLPFVEDVQEEISRKKSQTNPIPINRTPQTATTS
jgi:SPP1 family phage portal protein